MGLVVVLLLVEVLRWLSAVVCLLGAGVRGCCVDGRLCLHLLGSNAIVVDVYAQILAVVSVDHKLDCGHLLLVGVH